MTVGVGLVAALLLAGCSDSGTPNGTPSPTSPAPTTSVTPSDTSSPSPSATTTPTPAPGTYVFVIRGNAVTGPARVRVTRGDVVRLQVTCDRAEELHLHTYEKKVQLAPGRPAVLTFTASIPGVFEVELEGDHLTVTRVEVRA